MPQLEQIGLQINSRKLTPGVENRDTVRRQQGSEATVLLNAASQSV